MPPKNPKRNPPRRSSPLTLAEKQRLLRQRPVLVALLRKRFEADGLIDTASVSDRGAE